MPENAQPLYYGGDPSFPLGDNPHYSRTESNNVAIDSYPDSSKNYQFVAFRPGFSLQASELNEIQENFQMQMSLSISMMHNWITSGSGYLWNGWNPASPGGEGGAWDGNIGGLAEQPNTGIGMGGSAPSGGHDQHHVISGPGWRGATPLYPFKSPYQGGYSNDDGALVSVDTSISGQSTVYFNKGWWLVENNGYWDSDNDGDQPTDRSGLKHWVYLNERLESTIVHSSVPGMRYVVGFKIDTDYVNCTEDPTLADNASGDYNPASCGGSRYVVNIAGAIEYQEWDGTAENTNDPYYETREGFNPVIIIDTGEKTVRYMNNILIKTW